MVLSLGRSGVLQRSVSDGSAWFAALAFCPTNCPSSGNLMGPGGAEVIAGALHDKTSLTHLDLSGMCAGLVCGGQTLWRMP